MKKEADNNLIEVYDLKTWVDRISKPFWILLSITGIPSMLILFTSSNQEINDSLGYKIITTSFIIIALCAGVLHILDIYDLRLKKVNSTFPLLIEDDKLTFLTQSYPFQAVEKLIIRIRTHEYKELHSSNNYLEIKTTNKKYKLGLIIRTSNDLDKINLLVSQLKENNVNARIE